MKDLTQETLASLAIRNHQFVPVFEKYQLDFCCGGKQTLAEACSRKNISARVVQEQLELVMAPVLNPRQKPFSQMNAEELISYILIHHHFYLKQTMPQIEDHLQKVAFKHGDRFPYMKEVLNLFMEVRNDMSFHMEKEEKILFPMIKTIKAPSNHSESTEFLRQKLSNIISVMENEHQAAGDAMDRIKELTSRYHAPQGACTTFQVSLAELKEFEEDLHQHVHLENNLLFPLALRP